MEFAGRGDRTCGPREAGWREAPAVTGCRKGWWPGGTRLAGTHAPSEHAHSRAHGRHPPRPPRAPPHLAGLRSLPTPAARRCRPRLLWPSGPRLLGPSAPAGEGGWRGQTPGGALGRKKSERSPEGGRNEEGARGLAGLRVLPRSPRHLFLAPQLGARRDSHTPGLPLPSSRRLDPAIRGRRDPEAAASELRGSRGREKQGRNLSSARGKGISRGRPETLLASGSRAV